MIVTQTSSFWATTMLRTFFVGNLTTINTHHIRYTKRVSLIPQLLHLRFQKKKSRRNFVLHLFLFFFLFFLEFATHVCLGMSRSKKQRFALRINDLECLWDYIFGYLPLKLEFFRQISLVQKSWHEQVHPFTCG